MKESLLRKHLEGWDSRLPVRHEREKMSVKQICNSEKGLFLHHNYHQPVAEVLSPMENGTLMCFGLLLRTGSRPGIKLWTQGGIF